jgi:uncharacterized protein YecE (DUF72 family)
MGTRSRPSADGGDGQLSGIPPGHARAVGHEVVTRRQTPASRHPYALAHWAEVTPPAFRFAIKASKRITHSARPAADTAAEPLGYLYRNLAALGDKRGLVLFQLPPFPKKDLGRLQEFLRLLPADHRAVFEFRHDSWFDDEVYALLRSAGAALCLSEREDSTPPPLVETAPWGYVRLRLENYSDADLAAWAERLAATQWQEVHAYFMHEPTAPGYAAALLAAMGSGPTP